MNRKILGTALIVPVMGLALAGCKGIDFNASAQCSNGGTSCSGNYQQHSPGATFKNTPPVASPPPQPTATVTDTVTAPAPSVTPTVTDTPTADAVIQGCLPNPSEATLQQMANDFNYDLEIANCLNIPLAGNFAQQLQDSAVIAYETGQGNSQAGVTVWVASSGDVPCPGGRDVRSLTSLYHQYR